MPQARFLGVTPQDILDYQLPTHPLLDVDIKRAKDALKNDPFFKSHKPWQKAIEPTCSRWACAPSSRRSPSGGSTT